MIYSTLVSAWNFSLILSITFVLGACGVKAPPKAKTQGLPSIESPYVNIKKVEANEDVEKEEN